RIILDSTMGLNAFQKDSSAFGFALDLYAATIKPTILEDIKSVHELASRHLDEADMDGLFSSTRDRQYYSELRANVFKPEDVLDRFNAGYWSKLIARALRTVLVISTEQDIPKRRYDMNEGTITILRCGIVRNNSTVHLKRLVISQYFIDLGRADIE